MSKSKIRKRILKLRILNNIKNVQLNVKNIFNLLKKYKLKNKIIGGYYPVNFEIDDLHILRELERSKIKISLPVINEKNGMNFYLWSFHEILSLNRFGIPEPTKGKIVYPSEIEGFGLPIVEGMVAGIPVCALDTEVSREVGGSAVDYFAPTISSLVSSIKNSCKRI